MFDVKEGDSIAPAPQRARRTIAVLAALVTAGAGHVVMGRYRRAGGWFLFHSLCMLVAVAGVLGGHLSILWICLGMGLLAYPAAVVDLLRRSASNSQAQLPAWSRTVVLCLAFVIAGRA